MGSQNPSGPHVGQTTHLVDRDMAAPRLPVLPGTNPPVILNLVQSGGKQAALGVESTGLYPALALAHCAALGKLFALSGPRFSQFSKRDNSCGFISFTDAEWESALSPPRSASGRATRLGCGERRHPEPLLPSGLLNMGKRLPLGCRLADVCNAMVPRRPSEQRPGVAAHQT